ncbi:hypothetical protein PSPO01_00342 [Paraphaeosphaeria sporulosa]
MSRPTEPGAGLPTELPFIVSFDTTKVDHATRKLIRSHVMRGRNAKRAKGKSSSTLGLAQNPANRLRRSQVELNDLQKLYTAPSPERIDARLYFIGFPDDVDPRLFRDMDQGQYRSAIDFNFTDSAKVSGVALQILFPLLAEVGFEHDKLPWLHPSARDPVALYIGAFATQSFIDRVLRQQPESNVNQVSMLHLQKGLELLRERLRGTDSEAKISDATIGAVLDLATAALFHGDADTAKQHIRGLGKMIELRGGLLALEMNPGFLMEILRCDLSIALVTGTDPVFCCGAGETTHRFPNQMMSSFDVIPNPEFLYVLSPDLAEVWLAVRKFCLLVSLAAQTRSQFHPSTIYRAMTSAMYRLLHMSFVMGSWDETVRLGLLVYTHHVFLQGQRVKLPWNPLSQAYRTHLQVCEVRPAAQRPPSQVTLWLLMVGAISIFNVSEEDWLGEGLKRWTKKCHVGSWKDLQGVLKSCMWIPVLDDRIGQQTYNHHIVQRVVV